MDKRSIFLVLMVASGSAAASEVLVTRGPELLQVQFESRTQPATSERIADVPRVTQSSLPELQKIARPAVSSVPKAERYYSAPERPPIQGIELVNR